jgi:hypothetical protein
MRRRRRIEVLIAFASIAAGVAWWAPLDRLSTEEQQLTGTWWHRDPVWGYWSVMVLGPDRSYQAASLGRSVPPAGRWSVRGSTLVIDLESNVARRTMRPLASRIGLTVADVGQFPLASVSADELVIAHTSGERLIWVRSPTD